MNKLSNVNIWIPARLKQRMRKAAEARGLSMTALLIVLLEDALREGGK